MTNLQSFEDIVPNGNVFETTLIVSRKTIVWHSFEKQLIVINGTNPGPTLTVTLGDTVVVHVTNQLFDDETTIHWHGLSMRNVPWMDGIVNITQCPVGNGPRNNTITYRFLPQSAGTYWYHGHYHNQYTDGKRTTT